MFFGELLPDLCAQSQWREGTTWQRATDALLRLWRTCQTQPMKITETVRQDRARHACVTAKDWKGHPQVSLECGEVFLVFLFVC